MTKKKKSRKQAVAAARRADRPLTDHEKTTQKSRERRIAECMDLSEKLIPHLPKEHPAHQQYLLECTIWCNETRPAVLDRSVTIPEMGRTLNYTLLPEAGIPNKISFVVTPDAES